MLMSLPSRQCIRHGAQLGCTWLDDSELAVLPTSLRVVASMQPRLGMPSPTAITALLSTATSRLVLRLSNGGRGQELLPTVVAAKVERLSIAFGVESGDFVHGHSTDGVFGHGFRFFHSHVSFVGCCCNCLLISVLGCLVLMDNSCSRSSTAW